MNIVFIRNKCHTNCFDFSLDFYKLKKKKKKNFTGTCGINNSGLNFFNFFQALQTADLISNDTH